VLVVKAVFVVVNVSVWVAVVTAVDVSVLVVT